MAEAFETDRTGIEPSASLRQRLLQGAYLLFVALLGASLFYLVINQQAGKPGPSLNLEEIKTSADRLTDAERDSIIQALEADMVSEPLDLQILKKLVLFWTASGERARSDALALILSQRSFRDIEAQALALDISLKKQDYSQSIRILDAILRTKEKTQTALFPLLRAFAGNSGSLPALAGMLGSNPPWRADFLIDLAGNSESTDVSLQLVSMLKKTASPAQVNEIRALIARLLKDHNYERAYYVWLDSLPAQDLKKIELVFDGGFEANNRGLVFDWTFNRRKNVDVRITSRGNSQADNALQIDFVRNNGPFADVSQTLYLSAGNYRLEGEARVENMENDRGLVWKVFCVDGNKQPLVATPRRNGTSDWNSFTADFSVPDESCVMQRLVLVLDAKAALDQNISGRIWYDNLKITNLDLTQTE